MQLPSYLGKSSVSPMFYSEFGSQQTASTLMYLLPLAGWLMARAYSGSDVWPAGVTTAGQQSCRHSEMKFFNDAASVFAPPTHQSEKGEKKGRAGGGGENREKPSCIVVRNGFLHSCGAGARNSEQNRIKLNCLFIYSFKQNFVYRCCSETSINLVFMSHYYFASIFYSIADVYHIA